MKEPVPTIQRVPLLLSEAVMGAALYLHSIQLAAVVRYALQRRLSLGGQRSWFVLRSTNEPLCRGVLGNALNGKRCTLSLNICSVQVYYSVPLGMFQERT